MILPTKHLQTQRTLLAVGGAVLTLLSEPKTVSRLWSELAGRGEGALLTFDWFVLSLDFLYAAGALTLVEGQLRKNRD